MVAHWFVSRPAFLFQLTLSIELGLKPTFSTWSQVTMLHMYLVWATFRCFAPSTAVLWQQTLLDHFFYDADNKMIIYHNMHAKGTRTKYLKDLNEQWRGLLAAYDEGLVKGDAVLAGAIWRNLFKASEDVNIKHLALIVSFMRGMLRTLEKASEKMYLTEVMTCEFPSPGDEEPHVTVCSPMMDPPAEKSASGTNLDAQVPPGGNSSPTDNGGNGEKE